MDAEFKVLISCPLIRIVPESGSYSLSSKFRIVDFPPPLYPTNALNLFS